MKKVYSPKEVLIAVISYYANTDCDDFNATVSAEFDGEESSVILTIEPNEDQALPDKKKSQDLN